MAELRGLGEVQQALAERNGRVLAITVDDLEHCKAVHDEQRLAFAVLSDAERTTIRAYGLVHAWGHESRDIAIPAQLLVRRDGTIAWRHIASRITDRAYPSDTLAAIASLQ
jgi:peroxiredoxin